MTDKKPITDEETLLKKLKIRNWNEFGKKQSLLFAKIYKDVDEELLKSVIQRIPDFRSFTMNEVKWVAEFADTLLMRATGAADQAHKAFSDVRRICEKELDRGDLTIDQRKYLIDMINHTAYEQLKLSQHTLAAILLIGVAAIAATAYVLSKGSTDDSTTSDGSV